MAERILLGHFLTRGEAAGIAHVRPCELVERPDLLRIGGTQLQEVYFAFQFDRRGVRPDVGRVVRGLRRQYEDVAVADWLARSNPHLAGMSPLHWLDTGRDEDRVVKAASDEGPRR